MSDQVQDQSQDVETKMVSSAPLTPQNSPKKPKSSSCLLQLKCYDQNLILQNGRKHNVPLNRVHTNSQEFVGI